MRSMLRMLPLLLLAIPFRGLPGRCQTPVDPELATALQLKLDSCRTAFDVPGISATLLLPGQRYWNGATGVAHIGTLEPLDTFHVFQAASTTKLLTATIVFQLMEEGLLELDDTLGSFIAPLPHIPGSTRLRHLLNHRSGLADYLSTPGAVDNWFTTPDQVWTAAEILQQYSAPSLFAPNAAFSYSNTNYLLLGMVVEAVTGQPFHEVLQQRILAPLALEQAFFPPALPVQAPLAPGWTSFTTAGVYDTDATPVLGDCFSSFAFSAGALVTRPWELAHATRAVLDGGLLTPASLTVMRTFTNVNFGDGATGYGLGLVRYVLGGRTYHGHGGDISGYTQLAIHGLQDSVTLVLSINRNNAPRRPIATALLAVVHQALATAVPDGAAVQPVLALYPVPATAHLTLRGEVLRHAHHVEVVDALGRTVVTDGPVADAEHILHVGQLPAGNYAVRVSGPLGSAVKRFTKE